MNIVKEFENLEQLLKAIPKMKLDTMYFIEEYSRYIGLEGR